MKMQHQTKKPMKTNHKLTTWLAAILCLTATGAIRAGDQNRPQPPQQLRLFARPVVAYQQVGDQSYPKPDQKREQQNSKPEKYAPTAATAQPSECNKASKLIGMEVRNNAGEKLGDIKDIVINLDNSQVSYLVLSAGGVLGFGDKLLAVPLTAFTRSSEETHLVLQADRISIGRAESIGNTWPSVQNPSFGALPFWEKPSDKTETPNPNPEPPKSNPER
jgi:sporulation protein YlmC with PRC-barrel domain